MSKHDGKKPGLADQKYKPLKKMIKKSFKSISASVEAGKLPAVSVMDEYMAQAKAMVAYSGFGDESYPAFSGACESLAEAYRQKEFDEFAKRLAEISNIKNQCHKLYK